MVLADGAERDGIGNENGVAMVNETEARWAQKIGTVDCEEKRTCRDSHDGDLGNKLPEQRSHLDDVSGSPDQTVKGARRKQASARSQELQPDMPQRTGKGDHARSLHRGWASGRSSSRPTTKGAAAEALKRAACATTARDRYLTSLLVDHAVMTTRQLALLARCGTRTMQCRLKVLTALDVVEWFRPLVEAGSAPHHYVAGATGTALVAAMRNVEVCDLPYRPDQAARWAASPHLAHRLGVNEAMAQIDADAARNGGSLATWLAETACAASWGRYVRPDAYGQVAQADHLYPFFLEYDRGTEARGRLAGKLNGYAALAAQAGADTWILFAFETAGREKAARKVLAHPAVAVATAVVAVPTSPTQPAGAAGALWLPVGSAGPRLRIPELPDPAAHRATRGRLVADGGDNPW